MTPGARLRQCPARVAAPTRTRRPTARGDTSIRATRSKPALTALLAVGWIVACTAARSAAGDEPSHDYVTFTIDGHAAGAPLEPVDADRAGLDAGALDSLVRRAGETNTDALVILHDGRLVGDWRFGKPSRPIEAMSATKSVVNLAIGRLVTTDRLRIDDPVATFYPAWRGSPREAITVRQLLDHTSGLEAEPGTDEVYLSRDVVQLALDAPLVSDPGTVFFYNNKAVNLLAGIVEKASGRKLDEYLRDEVFAPLGVGGFAWMRDGAGNPHAMAGLRIDAVDLARVGQLMLEEGFHDGTRVLSADWVRESVRPGGSVSRCGLSWWPLEAPGTLGIADATIEAWRAGGADAGFIATMATLDGRTVAGESGVVALLDEAFGAGQGMQAYVTNVRDRGLPGLRVASGPIVGFRAEGYLGQYLVVLPESRLVAVRMIGEESFRSDSDAFADFAELVRQLQPPTVAR